MTEAPPQIQCDDDEPHDAHVWLDGHDLYGAGRAHCLGVASPADPTGDRGQQIAPGAVTPPRPLDPPQPPPVSSGRRPDNRELRAALASPRPVDERLNCPDHLLPLVAAIAPRPTPGPTGEPIVEQWAGNIRMVADQIWREAWHAGATWWVGREPARMVLDGPLADALLAKLQPPSSPSPDRVDL